ncbi:MAG: YadA-like family protein [Brachymonas sp.]
MRERWVTAVIQILFRWVIMNRIFKTIYSHLNKTCMAVPETARSCRSFGSSAASIGSVLVTLVGLATPAAQANYYVDGSMFVTSPTGISCARPGSTGTWSCEIPNGNGGFATISGIATANAADAVAAAQTWAATNLGANAVALGAGTNTVAAGAGAVAIGNNAKAVNLASVTIGQNAGSSIAFQPSGTTTNPNVTVGPNSGTNTRYNSNTFEEGSNIALGTNVGNNIVGYGNTAVGSHNTGDNIVGWGNVAMGLNSGRNLGSSTVDAVNNVAVGSGSGNNVVGVSNTAIGPGAGNDIATNDNTSIGGDALASGGSAVAIGRKAKASTGESTAIGFNANASGGQGLALGNWSTASGTQSIAAGTKAKASGNRAIALIADSEASGNNAIAIGNSTKANLGTTTVIGSNSSATETGTLGYGSDTLLGYNNALTDASRIAILGDSNKVTGNKTSNNANKSVVIGTGNAINTAAAAGLNYFKSTTIIGVDNTNISNTESSIVMGNANTVTGSGTESVFFSTHSKLTDSLLLGNSNTMLDTRAVAVIGGTNTAKNSYSSSITGINNTLTNASASNILGIGNTITLTAQPSTFLGVSRNDIQNNIIGVNNTIKDASKQNTVIGSYNILSGTSGQNFVAGFSNTLGADLVGNQIVANNATVATGTSGTVVMGMNGTVSSNNAVAIGTGATVTEADGVALGSNSVANTAAGIAGYVPSSASATQTDAITATTSTLAAVSVGDAANGQFRQITGVAAGTQDSDAVNVAQLKAVSEAAEAGAVHYYSVNDGGTPSGNYDNDGATGMNSMAAGINAMAEGANSLSMGYGNRVQGVGSTNSAAIGAANTVNASANSIALGVGNTVTGGSSVVGVLGGSNTVSGTERTAIVGVDNTVTDSEDSGVIGGTNTMVGSQDSVQIGNENSMALSQAVAQIGGMNVANASMASSMIGIGNQLLQSNSSSIIGIANTVANTTEANATGVRNTIDGGSQNSVIGSNNALLNSQQNFVAGFGNTLGAGLVGNQILASGATVAAGTSGAVIMGMGGAVSANNAVAIGTGATVTEENGVALGSGSVASTTAGIAGYVPSSASTAQAAAIAATTSTLAAVSVGDAANGQFRQITGVAAGTQDSDAVNVAQLKAVAETAAAAGQGWDIGQDTGAAPVGNVAPGKRVDFVAGNSNTQVAVEQDASGNSTVTVSSAPSSVQYTNTNLAEGGNDPNADQFTATDQVTLVGAGGSTAGGVTLNNVAAGVLSSNSLQAVNGSQLYAVGNSTAIALGGGSIFDPTTGQITASLTVDGNTYDNVQSALDAIGSVIGGSGGWNLQANGGPETNIPPAGTVNVVDGSNTTAVLNDNELQVNVVDNPTFNGEVTMNGGATISDHLTVNAGTTIDMGGNRITNVGAGVDPSDVVTMQQLQDAQAGSVKYATNPDGSINYNQVVLEGTPYDPQTSQGGTVINNVAAGEISANSSQAVNGSQLYQVQQSFFNQQNQINSNRKLAGAGIAGAIAQGSIRYDDRPGKFSMGIGVGTFDSQAAMAIGAGYTSKSQLWRFSVGASMSPTTSKAGGFGASASYTFN